MNITFTSEDEQEYEITMDICGTTVAMLVEISDVRCEADIWADDDWQIEWHKAVAKFRPFGIHEDIWEIDIYPADLDVVKNLTDAQISDACDEIAADAFQKEMNKGTIGA